MFGTIKRPSLSPKEDGVADLSAASAGTVGPSSRGPLLLHELTNVVVEQIERERGGEEECVARDTRDKRERENSPAQSREPANQRSR